MTKTNWLGVSLPFEAPVKLMQAWVKRQGILHIRNFLNWVSWVSWGVVGERALQPGAVTM